MQLEEIAKQLVASEKGILAADESTGTIEKRLASINVTSTEATRKAWRSLLFTTEGMEQFVSGVILYDETLRMGLGKLLSDKGVLPGIKVDMGAKDLAGFPGEKITEGLDKLRERLAEYVEMGAKFTKWRAVITIGENMPTEQCIDANAHALARYAALAQEAGLVPIVEPEVLMDGGHTIERCREVTEQTLTSVFGELRKYKVHLPGMLLKPNMVISGKESSTQASSQEIAQVTVELFRQVVPAEVPGIVFLSGGQTPDQATENLNDINKVAGSPWQLSYSYGRALQDEALKTWMGKEESVAAAQQAFIVRAEKVSKARMGKG